MKKITLLFLTICAFALQGNAQNNKGEVVLNGTTYTYVTIGTQTWMAENLNLDVGEGSSCYSDNKSNCYRYGRLYTWEAAKRAADEIDGWHLASDGEWKQLEMYLGMSRNDANYKGPSRGIISSKLKSSYFWSGSDVSGFSALPGGFVTSSNISQQMGLYAYFWTSTADYPNPWHRYINSDNSGIGRYSGKSENMRYSVRLIKD